VRKSVFDSKTRQNGFKNKNLAHSRLGLASLAPLSFAGQAVSFLICWENILPSLSDDIIRILGRIARNRSEITMLNIYKGLPISYETSIHSVGEFEICVPSSRQHIACLYSQRETYLQGKGLPFLIRSQVISLNLDKEDALLSNFEVAKPSIGKRTQIRVEPDELLIAFIQVIDSGFDLPAPLADISAEGASIYLDSQLFPARQCRVGREAKITLSFPDSISQKVKRLSLKPALQNWPDGKVTISAQAMITSVIPELPLNRYRVGMKVYFQDLARMVVLQYLSQRQVEIIRDLRLLAENLYSQNKPG
jgi:hypothetical protein